MIAVESSARGDGLGSSLIAFLEIELRRRGVCVWFGNISAESNVPGLVDFYSKNGFTIVPTGDRAPTIHGIDVASTVRSNARPLILEEVMTAPG